MTNEKVFASQQLICMLPALPLKVMLYLLNWQKYEQIKYYENQMCGFMHITKEELDLAIQTLIDNKLISVSKADDTWVIVLEKETIKKYFQVEMQKVHDHPGIKMATEVTWKNLKKQSSTSMDDMSDEQMKRMLLMLQAKLKEREEVTKMVQTASAPIDDLPW